MKTDRRQLLLKLVAVAVVGLYLLDSFVIAPAMESWSKHSDRIAALRVKVKQGGQLCDRGSSLRERWAGILRANLPDDDTNVAYKAWARWVRDSQISVTSFTPQWQSRDEGFDTLECRVAATGSQAALGRFLYEVESDQSVLVNIEECELTTRDPRGAQLALTARITFLRLKEPTKHPAP